MKIFVLAAVLTLCAVSCAAQTVTPYTSRQIAEVILASQADMPLLRLLETEGEDFGAYLSSVYQLEADEVTDAAVFYANGVAAEEIAVFLLAPDAEPEAWEDALAAYIGRRTDAFTGYAPEQAATLDNSRVILHGNYAALLICKDPQEAEDAFFACFSDNPPELPDASGFVPAPAGTAASDVPGAGDAGTNPPEAELPVSGGPAEGMTEGMALPEDAGVTGKAQESPDMPPGEAGGTDGTDGTGGTGGTGDIGEAPGSHAATPSEPGEPGETPGAPVDPGVPGSSGVPGNPGIPAAAASDEPDTEPDATAAAGEASTESSGKSSEDTPDEAAPQTDAVSPDDAAAGEAASPADTYDRAAILAAWESGDADDLSEKNKSILEACAAAIAELITAEMNGYEKELAIHDWLIGLAEYDTETLSNSPDAAPAPDNDNPYGLLFHRKAICLGYTLSFQLFMDMLEIECITVEGASGDTEHAWNMVRLEGNWYCVDVTWDDPSGVIPTDAVSHRYFNVSSEFLRNNKHQWEESGVPEAVSPKLYEP